MCVAETSLDTLDPVVMVAEDNAEQVATEPLDHQLIGVRVRERTREIARSTPIVTNNTVIHRVDEGMTGLVAISIMKLETIFSMQESIVQVAAEDKGTMALYLRKGAKRELKPLTCGYLFDYGAVTSG